MSVKSSAEVVFPCCALILANLKDKASSYLWIFFATTLRKWKWIGHGEHQSMDHRSDIAFRWEEESGPTKHNMEKTIKQGRGQKEEG